MLRINVRMTKPEPQAETNEYSLERCHSVFRGLYTYSGNKLDGLIKSCEVHVTGPTDSHHPQYTHISQSGVAVSILSFLKMLW